MHMLVTTELECEVTHHLKHNTKKMHKMHKTRMWCTIDAQTKVKHKIRQNSKRNTKPKWCENTPEEAEQDRRLEQATADPTTKGAAFSNR